MKPLLRLRCPAIGDTGARPSRSFRESLIAARVRARDCGNEQREVESVAPVQRKIVYLWTDRAR